MHYCALVAAHQSSHQFQSTYDWKHFATLVVVAVAAVRQFALDAAYQSPQQSMCGHHSMHGWSNSATLVLLLKLEFMNTPLGQHINHHIS
jgi:hypothetical protein